MDFLLSYKESSCSIEEVVQDIGAPGSISWALRLKVAWWDWGIRGFRGF